MHFYLVWRSEWLLVPCTISGHAASYFSSPLSLPSCALRSTNTSPSTNMYRSRLPIPTFLPPSSLSRFVPLIGWCSSASFLCPLSLSADRHGACMPLRQSTLVMGNAVWTRVKVPAYFKDRVKRILHRTLSFYFFI